MWDYIIGVFVMLAILYGVVAALIETFGLFNLIFWPIILTLGFRLVGDRKKSKEDADLKEKIRIRDELKREIDNDSIELKVFLSKLIPNLLTSSKYKIEFTFMQEKNREFYSNVNKRKKVVSVQKEKVYSIFDYIKPGLDSQNYYLTSIDSKNYYPNKALLGAFENLQLFVGRDGMVDPTQIDSLCCYVEKEIDYLADRFIYAFTQISIQKKRFFSPEIHVELGEIGELKVFDKFQQHEKFSNSEIFLNKRIPVDGQKYPYESDLIIVTPYKIYLIEVKNWKGILFENVDHLFDFNDESKESWCYKSTTTSPERSVKNLAFYNKLKVQELTKYIENQLSMKDIKDWIESRIVFCNPEIKISDPILENQDVLTLQNLDKYLNKQESETVEEQILYALICILERRDASEFIGNKKIEMFKEICATLDRLKSFDEIILHGGKRIKGDIHKIVFNGNVIDKLRDRENWYNSNTKLYFRWTREVKQILEYAIKGNNLLGVIEDPNGRKHSISHENSNYVEFDEVGKNEEKIYIPLINVDKITIG